MKEVLLVATLLSLSHCSTQPPTELAVPHIQWWIIKDTTLQGYDGTQDRILQECQSAQTCFVTNEDGMIRLKEYILDQESQLEACEKH